MKKPLTEIPRDVAEFWPEAYIVNPWPYLSPWDDPAQTMPTYFWGLTNLYPHRVDGQWPVWLRGDDVRISSAPVAFCVQGEPFNLPYAGWRPSHLSQFRGQLKYTNPAGFVEWNGAGYEDVFVADGIPSAVLKNCYAKPLPTVPYRQKHHTLLAEFTLFVKGEPATISTAELRRELTSLRATVDDLARRVGVLEMPKITISGSLSDGNSSANDLRRTGWLLTTD